MLVTNHLGLHGYFLHIKTPNRCYWADMLFLYSNQLINIMEKIYTVKPHFFEPWFLEHRRLFELYFKSRANSYTITLFEPLIIRISIIRTLELNQWSPRIIKHVVYTL